MLAEDEGEDIADDSSGDLIDIHDQAMRRFDSVAVPQAEMRAHSLFCRRFVTVPGAMWEDKWGELFENAPRPEVDMITQAMEKIETDYRENRLTVDFVPAGDSGDDTTADTLDGMHRADSYEYKAQEARDNAFWEALSGGFGAYRAATVYEDPLDPANDAKRVVPAFPIVDADQSVYFDGGSRRYDKSDAEWAFVITAMPRLDAEAEYGEYALPSFPLNQFRYIYDWFRPDVIRIAEYYTVEIVKDVRVLLKQAESGEQLRLYQSDVEPSAIRDLVAQGWAKTTRTVKRRRVRKYIMNGERILRDCGYIDGDSIPIIPVYGRRYFVDNMERWHGYVSKRIDLERIWNTMLARLVEQDSLSPREVPIVDPQQVTGAIADEWARMNIERHPFARLNALRNDNGDVVQAGPLGYIKPPDLPPARAALLQIVSQAFQDDRQNADEVKANVSAEAMDIAASRVDSKSEIYLDNMRQSIQREGEIYLGLARDVYWQPGRKVEKLSIDGANELATLAEPMLGDDGVYRVINDLQAGRYKVVADVQEATATRQQKTVRQCLAAAQVAISAQDMELAQAYLLTAGMNQEGEGMDNLQAWLRNKALAIGLVKPTPEEQQQIQQAQQQQQPSPTDTLVEAQAKALEAKAERDTADAQLKQAQASAVGGPDRAPDAPTGLSAPETIAEVNSKLASADLNRAKAEHLRHDIHDKTIRTGHEIQMMQRNGEGQ